MALLPALTGCVGYRHIAALENGGQSYADLKTHRDATVSLDTLAPKDSVVVADDGGTLVTAATNEVHVTMVEPESVPLGLGIPDFDLRFGAAQRDPKASDKQPDKRFVLAAVKEVSLRADLWQQRGFHELSEAQILQRRVPVVFRVIAYNAGNRDFEGAVGFNDRLATNVDFDKVLSTPRWPMPRWPRHSCPLYPSWASSLRTWTGFSWWLALRCRRRRPLTGLQACCATRLPA